MARARAARITAAVLGMRYRATEFVDVDGSIAIPIRTRKQCESAPSWLQRRGKLPRAGGPPGSIDIVVPPRG